MTEPTDSDILAFYTMWQLADEHPTHNWEQLADDTVAALKEMDQLEGDEKPDDHPDYDRDVMLARIRLAMSRTDSQ